MQPIFKLNVALVPSIQYVNDSFSNLLNSLISWKLNSLHPFVILIVNRRTATTHGLKMEKVVKFQIVDMTKKTRNVQLNYWKTSLL